MIALLPEAAKNYFGNIFQPPRAEYVPIEVQEVDAQSQQTTAIEPSIDDNEHHSEFIVAAITARKYDKKKQKYFWRVTWKGYPDKTWEGSESFISDDGTENDVWRKYEDLHPRKQEENVRPPTKRASPAKKKKKLE